MGIGPYKENKLEKRSTIVYDRWNTIRKKFVKDFFILLFASNIAGNSKTRQTIYRKICRSLALGIMTNQDIKFKDGKIENINIKDFNFLLDETTFGGNIRSRGQDNLTSGASTRALPVFGGRTPPAGGQGSGNPDQINLTIRANGIASKVLIKNQP